MLSSWGSSNYRPSTPFLYEVASHVKNCHFGDYYYSCRLISSGLKSGGLISSGLKSGGLISSGLKSGGLISSGLISDGLISSGLMCGVSAADIDECASAEQGCQQTCVNTRGSYHCACYPGSHLAEDAISCLGRYSAEYCGLRQTCQVYRFTR